MKTKFSLTFAVCTLLLTGAVYADGKAIYMKACSVCHATAVAGAPKFGDKAAWAPRIMY